MIYLFGSYAWVKPTADSDLDFMAVVKISRQKPIQRGVKAAVDVLVKARKEFEQYVPVKASRKSQEKGNSSTPK
jgi:predicted nucleotidyltransferase